MKCNMKYCIHCSGPKSAPKAQAIVPRRHLVIHYGRRTQSPGEGRLQSGVWRDNVGLGQCPGTILSSSMQNLAAAVEKSNSNFLAKPARCRRGTVNSWGFD